MVSENVRNIFCTGTFVLVYLWYAVVLVRCMVDLVYTSYSIVQTFFFLVRIFSRDPRSSIMLAGPSFYAMNVNRTVVIRQGCLILADRVRSKSVKCMYRRSKKREEETKNTPQVFRKTKHKQTRITSRSFKHALQHGDHGQLEAAWDETSPTS